MLKEVRFTKTYHTHAHAACIAIISALGHLAYRQAISIESRRTTKYPESFESRTLLFTLASYGKIKAALKEDKFNLPLYCVIPLKLSKFQKQKAFLPASGRLGSNCCQQVCRVLKCASYCSFLFFHYYF